MAKKPKLKRGALPRLKPPQSSPNIVEDIETPPAPTASIASPTFKAVGHRVFYQALNAMPTLPEIAGGLELINGLVGAAGASDDYHLASLGLVETQATDLSRRTALELADKHQEFCRLTVNLPGSRVDWKDGSFDFRRSGVSLRPLKSLAANSHWTLIPRIVNDDGNIFVAFDLQGILFEPGLSASIDERVREPNYRFARNDVPDPITVKHLGRDKTVIRNATREMMCVRRDHLPEGSDVKRSRYAHRLLQVRSMMPMRPITELNTGEGKIQFKAAFEKTKIDLPDRKAASSSMAPKTRRARDIVNLMRHTGFGDFNLPYVNF